ncbi:WecB/TagA/CpsF family glycosyltransferase [Planktomarina temperata]|nr:WecB/TagA/CpsF family glycosyltransferase [Planktomarina temperata]
MNDCSKSRVFHYLALIGWKKISNLKLTSNTTIFADSLSLYFLIKLFHGTISYLPGAKFLKTVDIQDDKYVILSPYFLNQFEKEKQYILEAFDGRPYVSEKLNLWLKQIPIKSVLLLAISSPKQNILANEIAKSFPFEIHCLGAAILEKNTSKFFLIKSATGHGVEWFARMLLNPKRFFIKTSLILREVAALAFSSQLRKDFEAFAKENNNEHS